MGQPVEGQVEEVWIKCEPIYDHDINIAERDPFTETVTQTSETVTVKLEIDCDGYECMPSIEDAALDSLEANEPRRGNKVSSFHCDECGKLFSRRYHLNRHKLIHSGEKLFSCNICGKRFSQNAHLSTHKLRHFDDRPTFRCEKCDKQFVYLSGLKRHRRMHKAYRCSRCSIEYSREESLIQHMKETHLSAKEDGEND